MAGSSLKQLLQEESVCFYVSSFVRSRQTFEQIRESFNDEQVRRGQAMTLEGGREGGKALSPRAWERERSVYDLFHVHQGITRA